jgi:hypothetical protein
LNAKFEIFRQDPRNEFLPIVESRMRETLASGEASTLFDAYNFACFQSPHVQEVLMARNRPRPQVARTPLDAAKPARP